MEKENTERKNTQPRWRLFHLLAAAAAAKKRHRRKEKTFLSPLTGVCENVDHERVRGPRCRSVRKGERRVARTRRRRREGPGQRRQKRLLSAAAAASTSAATAAARPARREAGDGEEGDQEAVQERSSYAGAVCWRRPQGSRARVGPVQGAAEQLPAALPREQRRRHLFFFLKKMKESSSFFLHSSKRRR